MTNRSFSFLAPMLYEKGRYHYLLLPDEVAAALKGVRRVQGTINGHPFNRGIQRRGDRPCLILGRTALRPMKINAGDLVAVELAPDPDPDKVVLCEELREAFQEDAAAEARYMSMTPGQKRSIVYFVGSPRRAETRRKRAYEIAYKLSSYTLYGDKPPDRGER